MRKHDVVKSLSNHHLRSYSFSFHLNTYYSIKSPICCHCNTNTRNTNCWSYNKLGKFSPVKKYFINWHYKIDRQERKQELKEPYLEYHKEDNSWFIWNYHTNACCRPEYAIRGMINNIFASDSALVSDLHRDLRDFDSTTSASEFLYPSLLLPIRLCRKHISIAPKVITKRNTINNKVVPLVLPPCSDKKQNQIQRICKTF